MHNHTFVAGEASRCSSVVHTFAELDFAIYAVTTARHCKDDEEAHPVEGPGPEGWAHVLAELK